MVYSQKLQKAIDFAIKTHQLDQNQKRKGKEVPYITHPMALGIILAKAGGDEDVIIAGILHDTIEDSVDGYKITKEQIAEEFGEAVAEMVNDVTEQDKSLPWEERKKQALEHIPHMSHGSILVKTADVLHNMRDQIADYEKEEDEMFKRFNAPKEKQLERYTKLVTAIEYAWPENPLLGDLQESFATLKNLWS